MHKSPLFAPTRTRPRGDERFAAIPLLFSLLLFFSGANFTWAAALELPAFDFKSAAGAGEWHAAHDISKLQQTPDGLAVEISGTDPYLIGPPRDYPPGTNLWLHLRLKSTQAGVCQVFYFRGAPTEEASVRFPVPAREWHDAQVPMPPLGRGYRLRIDPPGSGGICLLDKLWFSERVRFAPPSLAKPKPFVAQADALTVQSGPLKLIHNRDALGSFGVQIGGTRMASGHSHAQIGYLQGAQVHWAAMSGSNANTRVSKSGDQVLQVASRFVDPDGARWEIEQTFSPARENSIDVETRVAVDRDRSVLYLPLLNLFPGLGSFGTNKTTGLFAGLEYLDNEPSSSEADVTGPGAARQVPDALKITFPLMAIQAQLRYLGLLWEPEPFFSAIFDSPDRLFGSEGHVMGIAFPGSDGSNREESSLLPYKAEPIIAHKALLLRATLIGGLGESVAPAVEKYVKLRGLPPLPEPGFTARNYFNLAAHGWLDSKIREGDHYRHAAWPGFGAQSASDAALWMKWLAGKVDEPGLAARLTNAAAAAIAQVAPQNYNGSQIGHVRYPLPALIFGSVAENARQALAHGRGLLGRFQPDGSVLYAPPPKGPDYARTHWSHEANGLTATVVAGLLDAAIFSGDRDLLEKALAHLRAMDKFRNGVPRGAQTWEVPLHTPDILASGYLLRAYLLGYELTGDNRLLEQAKYWAWTGVPFIYLAPPNTQPVGLYSTIPVLGATSWTAPLWIGLPVQWCGLVYGEALYHLAGADSAGPWKQLADGIAIGGIQHTWPQSDREFQGLLPDSFQLRTQTRNPPPINPATLLPSSVRYYGQTGLYDFRAARRLGWLIHAPGEIRDLQERDRGVSFTAAGWAPDGTWLLVNGLRAKPRVKIDGQDTPLISPHGYEAEAGRLVLKIPTSASIQIDL